MPEVAAALDRVVNVVEGSDLTFGWFRDHLEQHIVVGVDPSKPPFDALISDIQVAAGDQLEVVVRPGCYSRAELEPVMTTLRARDWHPDPRLEFWSLAAIGRIVVGLIEPAEEQAQTLIDLFGQKVDVRLVDSDGGLQVYEPTPASSMTSTTTSEPGSLSATTRSASPPQGGETAGSGWLAAAIGVLAGVAAMVGLVLRSRRRSG